MKIRYSLISYKTNYYFDEKLYYEQRTFKADLIKKYII